MLGLLGIGSAMLLLLALRLRGRATGPGVRTAERAGEDWIDAVYEDEDGTVIPGGMVSVEVPNSDAIENLVEGTFDILNELNSSTTIQHAFAKTANGDTELTVTLLDITGKVLGTHTDVAPATGDNIGSLVTDIVSRVRYVADGRAGDRGAADMLDLLSRFVFEEGFDASMFPKYGGVRGAFLESLFRNSGPVGDHVKATLRALNELGLDVDWDVLDKGGWDFSSDTMDYLGRPEVDVLINGVRNKLGRFGLEADSYETILTQAYNSGAWVKQVTMDALTATQEALEATPGVLEKLLGGIGFDELRVIILRLQTSYLVPLMVNPDARPDGFIRSKPDAY